MIFRTIIQRLHLSHFEVRRQVRVTERHLHIGASRQFTRGAEVYAFHRELRVFGFILDGVSMKINAPTAKDITVFSCRRLTRKTRRRLA
jgi:hypothetical protein